VAGEGVMQGGSQLARSWEALCTAGANSTRARDGVLCSLAQLAGVTKVRGGWLVSTAGKCRGSQERGHAPPIGWLARQAPHPHALCRWTWGAWRRCGPSRDVSCPGEAVGVTTRRVSCRHAVRGERPLTVVEGSRSARKVGWVQVREADAQPEEAGWVQVREAGAQPEEAGWVQVREVGWVQVREADAQPEEVGWAQVREVGWVQVREAGAQPEEAGWVQAGAGGFHRGAVVGWGQAGAGSLVQVCMWHRRSEHPHACQVAALSGFAVEWQSKSPVLMPARSTVHPDLPCLIPIHCSQDCSRPFQPDCKNLC
jgi:hypothetical protein